MWFRRKKQQPISGNVQFGTVSNSPVGALDNVILRAIHAYERMGETAILLRYDGRDIHIVTATMPASAVHAMASRVADVTQSLGGYRFN